MKLTREELLIINEALSLAIDENTVDLEYETNPKYLEELDMQTYLIKQLKYKILNSLERIL